MKAITTWLLTAAVLAALLMAGSASAEWDRPFGDLGGVGQGPFK